MNINDLLPYQGILIIAFKNKKERTKNKTKRSQLSHICNPLALPLAHLSYQTSVPFLKSNFIPNKFCELNLNNSIFDPTRFIYILICTAELAGIGVPFGPLQIKLKLWIHWIWFWICLCKSRTSDSLRHSKPTNKWNIIKTSTQRPCKVGAIFSTY